MDFALSGVKLTKRYGQEAILEDVSFQVLHGEALGIIGDSGCGKSTLLSLLGLLQQPTDGEVRVLGENLTGTSHNRRSQIRRGKIGFVFQRANLIGNLSALDNVLVPAFFAGRAGELAPKARQLLAGFGLKHRLDHRPWELSLGQSRLVALARAAIMEPPVILADEPTNDLHPAMAGQITDWLLAQRDTGGAVVVVTHDMALAGRLDRCYRLKDRGLEETRI